MSTTYTTSMGDRGRMVVPARLRDSQNWRQGTTLLMLETDSGVLLATQEQARAQIKKQLENVDVVADLLNERRLSAAQEDAK